MPDALDFEQPLLELETRLATLQAQEDSPRLREEIAKTLNEGDSIEDEIRELFAALGS